MHSRGLYRPSEAFTIVCRPTRLPWRHFSKLAPFIRHVLTVGGPRVVRCQVSPMHDAEWLDTDRVVPLSELP